MLVGSAGFAHAGTIRGTVYVDADESGTFSAGDPVVEGAAVFFETSLSALTGPNGTFTLQAPDTDGLVWVRALDGFVPGPVFAAVAGGSASGVDLALRPAAPGGTAFIHASDPHVGLDEYGVPRELSAADLLFAIDQAVDPTTPPMFAVVTGDLVNGANRAEFESVREIAAELPVPLVPVPGNHDWYDGGANYRATFGPPTYSFDAGGRRFVVLNDNGREAQWRAFLALDAATGAPPSRPVIAFMHRPPTDAQLDSLETAGVGALFTGHWHSNMLIERGNLTEYNTEPLIRGGLDSTPAGYRIVELGADGLVVTHHTLTVQPEIEIVHPTGEICSDDPVELIAAVELGPGDVTVTAEAGGDSVPLERAGGWSWRGAVDLGSAQSGTIRVRARRGAMEVTAERAWTRCPRSEAPELRDWPQLGGGPQHRGASELPIPPPLMTLWARAVGGHIHGGSPIAAGGRVFVSISDFAGRDRGAVVAYDAASGAELWRHRAGGAVRNAPAASDGVLVFARIDGVVEALAADSGQPLWQFDLGQGLEENESILEAAPTISDGVVYVGVQRRFAALELETGALIWDADPATHSTLSSGAAAAVRDGTLVGSVGRGLDGAFAWSAAGGSEMWRTSPSLVTGLQGSPVFGVDTVYVTNSRGDVSAVSPESGEVHWTTTVLDDTNSWDYAIVGTPAFAGGRLFVPTQYGELAALDGRSGKVSWRLAAGESQLFIAHRNSLSHAFAASPAVTRDTLWLGGADGLLRAVDPSSGDTLWTFDLGSPVTAGVAPAGEVLFVATYDGTLRAMAASSSPLPETPGGCGCESTGGGPGATSLVYLVALVAIRRRRRRSS